MPWNGDVEDWAAGGPVRKDGGEREGLGGRVIRIETNGREMVWLTYIDIAGDGIRRRRWLS